MIAEGRSTNITLIFSLDRYAQVTEAYLSGLEAFVEQGDDLSRMHSVASARTASSIGWRSEP